MRIPLSTENYRIRIVDHFLDNLYGQIGVTEVERRLEKLPLFKRLHNISQLGLTHWVFPCALHTRYIHSLGVMHTAYNMALHINKNNEDFFDDAELQIIRLAGMLHDIGHYPLSHNVETAYNIRQQFSSKKGQTVRENLESLIGCPSFLIPHDQSDNPSAAENASEGDDSFIKKLEGSTNYHHEAIGKGIIANNQEIHDCVRDWFVILDGKDGKKLNPSLAPFDERGDYDPDEVTSALLKAIAEMVVGNFEYAFRKCTYKFQRKYSAMIQLIHSELDADNLDYLIRDATFSGTSYGKIDVDVLMNSLTVEKIDVGYCTAIGRSLQENEVAPDFYLVGIFKKGIGSVEQFFQNKYLAYSHMIHNKYVSSLEAMILHWAINSLANDKTYGTQRYAEDTKGILNFSISKETKAEFLQFNDAYVFQAFYKHYLAMKEISQKKQATPNVLVKAILSRLNNFTAFDLDDSSKVISEEIVVGLNESDIITRMTGPLYDAFRGTYEQFKDKTLESYYDLDDASKLFAYRFERFVMTKQKPFNDFCDSEISEGDSEQMKIRKHFYRLANGVPILKKTNKTNAVQYRLDVNAEKAGNIPALIVDSDASILKETYQQQVVSLRKYKICDYGVI